MERQGRALVAQRPGARGWEGAGWRTLGRLVIFPVHWCERGWWTRERDSSLGTQSEAVDKALAGSGSWSLAIFGGGGVLWAYSPPSCDCDCDLETERRDIGTTANRWRKRREEKKKQNSEDGGEEVGPSSCGGFIDSRRPLRRGIWLSIGGRWGWTDAAAEAIRRAKYPWY